MIELTGTVIKEDQNLFVITERKSGIADRVPIRLKSWVSVDTDKLYTLYGDIRTYNEDGENGKSHLRLYVLVDEAEELEEIPFDMKDQNYAKYYCTICKKSAARETLSGKVIAEFIAAINYPGGKSAFVPCITWGDNAIFMNSLETKTELLVTGRLQSRSYIKHNEDGSEEEHETYELSCSRIKVVK